MHTAVSFERVFVVRTPIEPRIRFSSQNSRLFFRFVSGFRGIPFKIRVPRPPDLVVGDRAPSGQTLSRAVEWFAKRSIAGAAVMTFAGWFAAFFFLFFRFRFATNRTPPRCPCNDIKFRFIEMYRKTVNFTHRKHIRSVLVLITNNIILSNYHWLFVNFGTKIIRVVFLDRF